MKFPYYHLSIAKYIFYLSCFSFCSIYFESKNQGVTNCFLLLHGLEASNPASCNMSRAYFLWHREMPFVPRETSKPRKYFTVLKSFMLNFSSRRPLTLLISSISVHARTKSSTYTRMAVNPTSEDLVTENNLFWM